MLYRYAELKTDHLDDIYKILEDQKDWQFKLWEIKKYIKVNEFVEFIRVKEHNLINNKKNHP